MIGSVVSLEIVWTFADIANALMAVPNLVSLIILTPVIPLTLEKAIEFINEDELVEVTPKNIRLRKTVLSAQKRYRE